MKKMIKMAMIAVGAALLFVGCSKGPDKVAVKFMESFAAGDMEAASKYTTKATGALLALANEGMKDDKSMKKMKGAKFEVVETKIDGDNATVKIKATKDGESEDCGEPITLVKEDGDWKVSIKKD